MKPNEYIDKRKGARYERLSFLSDTQSLLVVSSYFKDVVEDSVARDLLAGHFADGRDCDTQVGGDEVGWQAFGKGCAYLL